MERNAEDEKKYINLSNVENLPHSELFKEVATVIAEKNLQYVNGHDVIPALKNTFYSRYGKRMLDVCLSSIALVVTLPLNLVLGMLTFFDVGRPIFFHQKRVGKNNKLFVLTKFRNMTNDKDKNGDLLPPSERVTRLGKFVRKTSIDELLNFWSVFKGDMSLIGPRPLLTEYIERYSERHKKRHLVKPGLECPIMNLNNNRDAWGKQFENDVYYVEHISLGLDLKMTLALVRMVFDRKSREARGSGMRGTFMGYERDGSTIDSCKVPIEYYEEAVQRLECE